MNEILVSIICNTYNHEDYIRDALNGFVMQKTNFPFEILIHDDASTDKTPDIIKEFAEKYPDLIKPIYQQINQYSQKIDASLTYQYPRVKGKYIAMCEGDDYWINPNKLQMQVDLMESHPDVNICAHASKTVDADTGKEIAISKRRDSIGIISTEDVIKGGGGFVATASIMYRSALLKDLPKFRKMLALDWTIQVHGALHGGMLYIPEIMSVYRANSKESWTRKMRADINKKIEHKERVYKMLKQMDLDTHKKYHHIILYMLMKNRIIRYALEVQKFVKR